MVSDLPPFMVRHRVLISRACIAIVIATGALQVVELFTEVGEWLPMGVLDLSAVAIGVDAMVRGVRKQSGEGFSIRNLAPGGWTVFAAMFWIVAIPAYFIGARRRAVRGESGDEPVMAGSWLSVVTFAVLGVGLVAIEIVR